jgi:hypothetical protein
VGVDRVTIQDAARLLGISEGAVRKRVKRGALEHDKEPDGRLYVYLDGGRRGIDDVQDAGVDHHNAALISRLEDEIAYLREESRRKDEIIMQQAVTMRALTAAEQGQEPVQREEPPTHSGGSEAGTQRPWWRFWR